jgi:hypothetical protein
MIKTKKICSILVIVIAIHSTSFAQIRINNDTIINANSNWLDINYLPFNAGEVRIIDFLDLIPGIHNYRDNPNSFSMFGSPTEQNMFAFDNAPLLQTSNMTINTLVFDGIVVHQTNKPLKFNNGLSSITEFSLKTKVDKFKFIGQVTPVSIQLAGNVPIAKRSSLIISTNYMFGKLLGNKSRKFSDLYGYAYFNDSTVVNNEYNFLVKYNYELNDKNSFSLTYNGLNKQLGLERDNAEQNINLYSLNWTNKKTSRILILTGISNSISTSHFLSEDSIFSYKLSSKFNNFNGFTDVNQVISHSCKLNYGISINSFLNQPLSFSPLDTSFIPSIKQVSQHTFTISVYAVNKWKINKWIDLNVGFKYSVYNQLGPDKKSSIEGSKKDIVIFSDGKIMQTYQGILPIFKIDLKPSLYYDIVIEYESNIEFLSLYPEDLFHAYKWSSSNVIQSTNSVKPRRSNSVYLTFSQKIKEYQFQLMTYYRQSKGLIELKEGTSFSLDGYNENLFLSGFGDSYGITSSIQKSIGNLTGWINYSYIHSTRKFDGLNFNKSFNPKYVKNHNFSFVSSYNISRKWNISTIFKYFTGENVVLPINYYLSDKNRTVNVGDNLYKTPDYYRFDLAINRTISTKTTMHHLSFGLYNLLCNLFFKQLQEELFSS